MRKLLIAAVALCGMTGFALADEAKPVPMTDAQLSDVVASGIVAFSWINQQNYSAQYAAAAAVAGLAVVNNAQATNLSGQSNSVN